MRPIFGFSSCAARSRSRSDAFAPLLGASPESGPPGSPNLAPVGLPPRLDGLAGKRDAGDEDVHLADLETKHPLRRLDHVALHGAGDRRELRLRVD